FLRPVLGLVCLGLGDGLAVAGLEPPPVLAALIGEDLELACHRAPASRRRGLLDHPQDKTAASGPRPAAPCGSAQDSKGMIGAYGDRGIGGGGPGCRSIPSPTRSPTPRSGPRQRE